MMKIKALIYCTKSKPYLFPMKENKPFEVNSKCSHYGSLNGKIVCECEVETEEIECIRADFNDFIEYHYITKHLQEKELIKHSCVDFPKLQDYLRLNNGYALHLSNAKERVMELNQVCKYDNSYDNMFGWVKEEDEKYIPIEKAPQNMMWVYVCENGKWVKYLLISIRPQWCCLIGNKIKDIEVRRKVLKGMCE